MLGVGWEDGYGFHVCVFTCEAPASGLRSDRRLQKKKKGGGKISGNDGVAQVHKFSGILVEPVKNNCETEIVAFVFWLFDKKETNQKALEKRSAPQICFVPKVLLLLFLCLSHSTAPNLPLIVELIERARDSGELEIYKYAEEMASNTRYCRSK